MMASAITMASAALSPHDTHILTTLFDPSAAPTPGPTITPSLPPDPHVPASRLLSLRKREREAISLVEAYEAKHREASQSRPSPPDRVATASAALKLLDKLVADEPAYASAWNNRAQVRRWQWAGHPACPERSTAMRAALADCDTAISLATPPPGGAVSPAQARVLAVAWTQRGAVVWEAAKRGGDGDGEELGLEGDKVALEEEGSRCFFMAGVYGGEVGRGMAVVANPHARLCGGVVREAMRAELGF
ncbi:hypothetical protein EJ06DRAFT_272624 [Trichodelitschia bisporula]|uniref:Uncharacterized protein n=1 Tax=Trichodelitschia bisporula TaxID=703511 RepID=A0A6G1I573_9PEZI|nr:hypothetical protein EJ06DRAFT_272624 [Trichodelitschia bisporula]